MNSDELILVTGATGFLGVRLVHELLHRHPEARLDGDACPKPVNG